MKFPKQIIINSQKENPYISREPIKHNPHKIYNGKVYEKITYTIEHGSTWRFAQACLAFLAVIALIPICVDSKLIKKLWKRAETGEELKVVLIAKKQIEKNVVNPDQDVKNIQNKDVKENQLIEKKEIPTLDQIKEKYPHLSLIQVWFLYIVVYKQNPIERSLEELRKIFDQIDEILTLELSQACLMEKGDGDCPEISFYNAMFFQDLEMRLEEIKYNLNPHLLLGRQIRSAPFPSAQEAQKFNKNSGKIEKTFGILFNDEEIIEKEEIEKVETLGLKNKKNIFIKYTKYNKPILQQKASYGCTRTVAHMLILENKGQIDLDHMAEVKLGNNFQLDALKEAGLTVINSSLKNEINYLQKLKDLINVNGSAIVPIFDQSKGFLIVDEISPDLKKVRVRDPFHGWEITVTAEAFLKKKTDSVIQVQKKEKK